jgi:hypothetical protein
MEMVEQTKMKGRETWFRPLATFVIQLIGNEFSGCNINYNYREALDESVVCVKGGDIQASIGY